MTLFHWSFIRKCCIWTKKFYLFYFCISIYTVSMKLNNTLILYISFIKFSYIANFLWQFSTMISFQSIYFDILEYFWKDLKLSNKNIMFCLFLLNIANILHWYDYLCLNIVLYRLIPTFLINSFWRVIILREKFEIWNKFVKYIEHEH